MQEVRHQHEQMTRNNSDKQTTASVAYKPGMVAGKSINNQTEAHVSVKKQTTAVATHSEQVIAGTGSMQGTAVVSRGKQQTMGKVSVKVQASRPAVKQAAAAAGKTMPWRHPTSSISLEADFAMGPNLQASRALDKVSTSSWKTPNAT